jgi:hypothetical protein
MVSHPPKLQIYLVLVVIINQLKVLHTGFVHTSVEVEHKRLDMIVPLWRLIEEHEHTRTVAELVLGQHAVVLVLWLPNYMLTLGIHGWEEYAHLAGSFTSQYVGLVENHAKLLSVVADV